MNHHKAALEEIAKNDPYRVSSAGNIARRALAVKPDDGRTIQLPAVSPAELGAILAALRFYQVRGMAKPENRPNWLHLIATDGDVIQPGLDDTGIDTLYDHING